MKLIHLSDLHLGKRVNEFSMLEDQAWILRDILKIIETEQPNGVILAGDIYDKTIPPAEAVTLLDHFLVELNRLSIPVFAISGNHDSPERLAFASRLLAGSGVYFAPLYDGTVTPVSLEDSWGRVNIYLLPFLKPAHVRRFYPEAEIQTYTQAMEAAISHMAFNPNERNVLVTHQFVAGASRCDSEELSIGGTDGVDVRVLAPFDYVALGHLHGPQWVGRQTVRYCGTPLKYSFSEAHHHKSVTITELMEKGKVEIRTVPLTPKRDMWEIRGTYEEVIVAQSRKGEKRQDYVHVTLTDEEEIPYAMDKLRVVYPNLMRLDYDNRRSRTAGQLEEMEEPGQRDPLALLGDFYAQQNGKEMGQEQAAFVRKIWEKIQEEQV